MDWYSHTKASVAHYDIPTELKNGLDQDLDLGLEWELQICLSVAEETETDTERETEGISGCCDIVRCLSVCPSISVSVLTLCLSLPSPSIFKYVNPHIHK